MLITAIYAIGFYVATIVLIVGVVMKIMRFARTPSPLVIPTTPAPMISVFTDGRSDCLNSVADKSCEIMITGAPQEFRAATAARVQILLFIKINVSCVVTASFKTRDQHPY